MTGVNASGAAEVVLGMLNVLPPADAGANDWDVVVRSRASGETLATALAVPAWKLLTRLRVVALVVDGELHTDARNVSVTLVDARPR